MRRITDVLSGGGIQKSLSRRQVLAGDLVSTLLQDVFLVDCDHPPLPSCGQSFLIIVSSAMGQLSKLRPYQDVAGS